MIFFFFPVHSFEVGVLVLLEVGDRFVLGILILLFEGIISFDFVRCHVVLVMV
jgi:hypothetical protein